MTTEHAIDVLKNEERCIANSCRCDRQCQNCELVLPDNEILEAYELAIRSLSVWKPLIARLKLKQTEPLHTDGFRNGIGHCLCEMIELFNSVEGDRQ